MENRRFTPTSAHSNTAAAPASAGASIGTGVAAPADYSLNSIMTAAGETAYYWDLLSDKIVWAPNAPAILGVSNIRDLRTGDAYDALILEGLRDGRRQALLDTEIGPQEALGVPFSIQYRFGAQPKNEPLWLEDHGRFELDANGRPFAAKGVVRIITDRYDHEQHLDYLSRHDPLTGQFNRRELCEAVGDALMSAGADGDSHAFMLVSINNLFTINEAFGFDTGDEVIAAVAKRLRRGMRDEDVIGRFSSSKFGLLLSHMGESAMAAAAERMLRAVRDEVIGTSLGPVAVTISIGGVLIPQYAEKVSEAVGYAQEALAKSRARPHDMFTAFAPGKDKQETRRRNREIANELLAALNEQRLALALQPIVDVNTLKTVHHECLLRIRQKDGDYKSAGDSILVAEQLGLIRLLDYRVLELAIDVAYHQPDYSLTINVSGLTTTDKGWLELLASLIDGDRQLSSRLIIEITETAALQDIEESRRFVQQVKQLGCRVAMDDFGTGYNSFRNLQLLGLDMVKIDGSFIENMRHNADDQLFVKILCDLARQFDLKVVAENVGDEETVALLRKAGVTHLQGYHFSQPVLALPEEYRNA